MHREPWARRGIERASQLYKVQIMCFDITSRFAFLVSNITWSGSFDKTLFSYLLTECCPVFVVSSLSLIMNRGSH
jgi:hypothetical protein